MVSGGSANAQRRRRAGADTARPPRPPPTHTPREVIDQDGVPYILNRTSSPPTWHSTMETLLNVARLTAGIWSGISDCDETFNYWEPAHLMIYGQGMQTWEYSPQFALRSYLYILVHAVPGSILARLTEAHRMYVFYALRCAMALLCACAEAYFLRGVRREIGANCARLAMIASLLSCAMFHASPSFLPSTTSMVMTALAYGAWFRRRLALATFFIAISAILRYYELMFQ